MALHDIRRIYLHGLIGSIDRGPIVLSITAMTRKPVMSVAQAAEDAPVR
jgi:hypothetical protein